MSLNVGGIYVATDDAERVEALIREYWADLGAGPLSTDPLEIGPLSLEKTGELGFAVAAPATNERGQTWVAVYDSERYRADPALARHLAHAMSTTALFYEMGGATNSAFIEAFGDDPPELPRGWDEIEAWVGEHLPYAFLYFNQLSKVDPDDRRDFQVFGFEGIPHRPSAKYSGPSAEEKKKQTDEAQALKLLEAGDVRGVRQAMLDNEAIAYAVRGKIADQDPNTQEGRRLLLAFAEELLTDGAYYRVAPLAAAALLDDEAAMFDRACASLGEKVDHYTLSQLAFHLGQAGDLRRSLVLWRAITRSSTAKPTAWNNLAWTLASLGPETQPDDAASLLEAAGAHGPVNPPIFHNTACGWMHLKRPERALDDIEAALRYGYEHMDALLADEDFAPLHDDPRFQAVANPGRAAAMTDFDVMTLEHRVSHRGVEHVVMRPVFGIHLFPHHDSAAAYGRGAAAVLERYVSQSPAGALAFYRSNGPWKPLHKAKITRDRNQLAKAQDGDDISLHVTYGNGDTGGADATDYRLDAEYVRMDGTTWTSVALTFPWKDALDDPDAMQALFIDYVERMRPEAAAAGLFLQQRKSDYLEVWNPSELLTTTRARLLGEQHHPHRAWEEGTTAGISWLNWLGSALVERLGGRAAIADAVPCAVLTPTDHGGLCIRTAQRPPVGLASNPRDLGCMPSVARLFAPLRVSNSHAAAWLARLDALDDGEY